jgi:hypothetical protein
LKIDLAYYSAGEVVVNSGANRMIMIYNPSVVKFYNATSSLVRFENKIIFIFLWKTLWSTTTLAL